MAYWCVVRSEPGREATAASFLVKSSYEIYLPRIREWRVNHGRRVAMTPSLFPNYLFCRITAGWWNARWCCGVATLIMGAGDEPAKVADTVIDGIRGRERNGYVELPEPPRLRPGDPIKVTTGLIAGASGLVSGMRGPDRVAVLLGFLGTAVLPVASVEAV
jgi:hypothetical protein